MKLKIFRSTTSNDQVENYIANWTKDLNPIIHDVKITALQLQDYYGADHEFTPNGIRNQWIEYTAVVVYDLPNVDNPLIPDEVTNRKEYIEYILTIHGIKRDEL